MKLLFVLLIALFEINSSYGNTFDKCTKECPHGILSHKEEDGKLKCVCASDLCDQKLCPSETVCQIKEETKCQGKNCNHKKFAVCVSMNKKGICPVQEISGVYKSDCKLDSDCHGENKCCPNSGFKICMKPCYKILCKCPADFKVIYINNPIGCPMCNCVNETSSIHNEVCQLPSEIGPCKAAFSRYYYDPSLNQCQEFFYGGCKGNENNFHSKELCEAKCKKMDSVKEICLKPKEIGPCKAAFRRFYYNTDSKKCEEFIYGGCKPNENNFFTLEGCQSQCESNINHKCLREKKPGMCYAYFPRYFFNSTAKECQEFVYGGCGGNENNFENLEQCNQNCSSFMDNQSDKILKTVCKLEKDSGSCNGVHQRYFFNSTSNQCQTFNYGGCEGNQNNFLHKDECEKNCVDKAVGPENTKAESVCYLEKKTGPCYAQLERFHFNLKTKTCEPMTYGGCKGNENNFETKEDCEKSCEKLMKTNIPIKCKSLPDAGRCRAHFERYFYNVSSLSCEKFGYGGCEGNENNFETKEECLKTCDKTKTEELINKNDNCTQEKDSGPCKAYFERYFFNTKSNKCERFVYGGCQGNKNNYESKQECEKSCLKNFCDMKPETGRCTAYFERFFYNSTAMQCQKFVFGGCDGNKNNFLTMKECENECAHKTTDLRKVIDPCTLPKKIGPCEALIPMFYYDKDTKKCTPFDYGGCKGNENQFKTIEDCNKICNK